MDQEKYKKMTELAIKVLTLSKNTLLVKLRFLDIALSVFKYHPYLDEEGSLSSYYTNGEVLIFNPRHVLNTYRVEKNTPVRDYLHIVLHCVFRHMYMNPSLNRAMWDLACDIAVECIINDLGLDDVNTSKVPGQKAIIDEIKKSVKILTAEKIYSYLVENVTEDKAEKMRFDFYSDNHEIWYMTDKEIQAKFGVSLNGDPQNGESDDSQDSNGGQSGENNYRIVLKNTWADIAERMQTDLETFSIEHGNKAGDLVQNLKAVNREKYDYTAFLKKFAVLGEALKVNDDEFDYVFYTYGLKLYEKMPLVEPLEYKDVKRIKEFVIAIDTSGSVSGSLVQNFVQKTYNILKSTESFFNKINLHIIQCDAEIQEHVKITTQEEFDEYLKNMTIKGLGGTDFRPVFKCVNELILKKEFTNLKGLIYFTDGYGEFPQQKPAYDTAFVFIDEDYKIPEVPAWAIKLILEKDDLKDGSV